jgi:hypothetical protein
MNFFKSLAFLDVLVTSEDEIDHLAKEFVERHGLKKGFQYIICNHIRNQMEQANKISKLHLQKS